MRVRRLTTPGTTYHVISRFVDRSWELRDDEERECYLRLLGRALSHSDWRCLAYALMSSHIHLSLVAGEMPMSAWIKRVHSPFANWLNERHERLGPVFADRPKQHEIRPADEAFVIAYIHNNPVRARVVACARQSSWTSHRAYTGDVIAPPWLHVEEGLTRAGLNADEFDHWVNGIDRDLEVGRIEEINKAARKRGGMHVATPTTNPFEAPLVARSYSRIRHTPHTVLQVVADVTGIESELIASRITRPNVVAAKRIAIHTGVGHGLTGSQVADLLGLSRQTASRLLATPLGSRERDLVETALVRLGHKVTDGTPSPALLSRFAQLKRN